MEAALGKLGWPPAVFWSASWREYTAAIKGLADFHGGGSSDKPMTKAEADALVKRARELDAKTKGRGNGDR